MAPVHDLNQNQLKRTIGLPGALGVSMNQIIGGGIVSLTGVAIAMTGGGVPWAFLIAVVTISIVSIPYASLASAVPTVGGTYTWAARILHPRLGFLTMWMMVIAQVSASLYGLSAGAYVNALYPGIDPALVAVLIITIFYVANLLGASFSSRVGLVLLVVMLSAMILFAVYGMNSVDWQTYPEALPNGTAELLSAAALLTFATGGAVGVAELGREMKNPGRDIPIAMVGGTAVVGVLYIVIAIPAAGVLPLDMVAGQPLSVVAEQFMPRGMWLYFVLGGAMVALISTLNAQLLWGTKGLVAAIDDGWLPRRVGAVNRRFGTPHILLTVLYVIGILPAVVGFDIAVIGSAASALGQVLFIVVLLVTIRLRYSHPAVYDRAPFRLPLTAHWCLTVVGVLVAVYQVYLLARDFSPLVWTVLLGWMVVGALLALTRYPTVRRVLGSRDTSVDSAAGGDAGGAKPPEPARAPDLVRDTV